MPIVDDRTLGPGRCGATVRESRLIGGHVGNRRSRRALTQRNSTSAELDTPSVVWWPVIEGG